MGVDGSDRFGNGDAGAVGDELEVGVAVGLQEPFVGVVLFTGGGQHSGDGPVDRMVLPRPPNVGRSVQCGEVVFVTEESS